MTMDVELAAKPSTGTKRKSSVAGLPGSTRLVKRRASKACHCCRSRKVRCDVVESGIPCTNCRLDEVDCVVTEGKRRKKSYVEGDVLNRSPVQSLPEKEDIQTFPLFDDIDAFNDLHVPTAHHVCSQSTPSPRTFEDEMKNHRPHLIYQTHNHRLSSGERHQHMPSMSHNPRLSITPVQLPPHLQYHAPTPPRSTIILPRYITPIPRQMLSEDLDYLQRKGAFHLPDVSIRNELLRSYVQYVHPYLPLLDLQEFLSAIEKDESSNTVSLLLYHAVMFAASAFIDMRYLTAQGFSSRKSARKVYFQRVKLLYDFDWEIDRVTVVQSVLLMTFWYESPSDPKDVWYWLGIAISIARTIGMNYGTEGTSMLSPQKQKLWKRVWWSTYIRDRVIAIGMRRPIRVRDEDFDVSMLTLDDFETDPLSPELCRMLGGCSAVRDGSKRKTLARMCITLTQVCQLITNVLAIQYSCKGQKIGGTSETTVRLVPRATGADSSEVIRCDKELESWYASLPHDMRYFKPDGRERTNNHDGEVICVHRALLTSVYLTATSALHRPQMMPAMPNLVVAPELKELSKRRVHDAALDITEIYRDLYAHDLIRYLPNTGVTVLLPAIIIHLMDIKSPDNVEKQTSMRHFRFCMSALQKLRDLYSSADFAFSFLDAAIKQSDLANDGAPLLFPDETSGSTSRKSGYRVRANASDPTLTPPPDGLDSANSYVDQSSLLGIDRSRFDALTPPSVDQNLSTTLGSGISVSLQELENFIGLDKMQNDESDFHAFAHAALDQSDGTPVEPDELLFSETSRELTSSTNEFDRLMSLDAGPELFAPNQVNMDDNLFKDIDMEWLADTNEDEETTAELFTTSTKIGGADARTTDDVEGKQVATPPSSTATPRSQMSYDASTKMPQIDEAESKPEATATLSPTKKDCPLSEERGGAETEPLTAQTPYAQDSTVEGNDRQREDVCG